jgi:hypothetical protein
VEATQSSNLYLDEDDVEDISNEGDVIDSATEDDIDAVLVSKHDKFSILFIEFSPSRGTMTFPPSRAIVIFVPIAQESPQSPKVAEVQVHPSLLY